MKRYDASADEQQKGRDLVPGKKRKREGDGCPSTTKKCIFRNVLLRCGTTRRVFFHDVSVRGNPNDNFNN